MIDTALVGHLDELLAQDPKTLAARTRGRYDEATGNRGRRIVLFGAGALGCRTLAGMRKLGLAPIAIIDNNVALHGTHFEGIGVLSPPEGVRRFGAEATFVIAIYNTSGPRAQLASLGARCVVPYAWLYAKYPDAFLPHVCLGAPELILPQAADVRRGFELMADDFHRRVFIEQLRFRMFLDFDHVGRPQTEQLRESEYFPTDLYRYRDDEVLIDCGAFDGDTVRRFLRLRGDNFARLVACEPDPETFRRLSAWHASLPAETGRRVMLRNVAVGARRETLKFAVTATVESKLTTQGGQDVPVEPIDDMLDAGPPTLVKVDTEGAELEVIAGASRSIVNAPPVFACSVYHTADHLWRVPLALHRLQPGYRFYLRAHGEDCWDAACYAIPEDRFRG